MRITVGEETYEVVLEFPVYHIGWEMDNIGWIVSDNGTKRIVLTNHGRKRFYTEEYFKTILDEYKKAHKLHIKALFLLNEKAR